MQHMYLGYRINPKLLFLSPFFFRLSFGSLKEKRRTTMNTSGGGTGGGREQQQTRNQEAVGSGDNVVPTKFSSKQSKTSTVTITGALIVYIVRSFFDSISLSCFLFNLSLSDDDEDECADFFSVLLLYRTIRIT